VVIQDNTPFEDAVRYLYFDTEYGLKIPKPKFILSIIGGSDYFEIDYETEKAFKIGLMKAAKISDTWIITAGIDDGVMRLVGDAVDEDSNSSNLTVLGITSRKKVYGSYPQLKLISDIDTNDSNRKLLNRNHSSFIFVENEDGNEIDYRIELENYIQKTLNIQIFKIVVNGNYDTLENIESSIERNLPIMIVAVIFLKIHI
jgi:hypothetical protein